MVVPFRRSFSALIFCACRHAGAAQPDTTAAEDRGAILLQPRNACIVGHRFEPGPIAEGHNLQPTVREFQARMQELWELEQRDAYRCSGSPVGNEAITQPSPAC
jgi:hypothetical protein